MHLLCRVVRCCQDQSLPSGKRALQVIREALANGLIFSDRSFPITAAKRCDTLEELEFRLAAQDICLQVRAHAYSCPPSP